jgi:hypothetical protein
MWTMPTGLLSSTTSSAVIEAALSTPAPGNERIRRDGLRIVGHLVDRPLQDVA